jgi:hypothetical protein
MDGTGTHDNHQALIAPLKNFLEPFTAFVDKRSTCFRQRKDLAQVARRDYGGYSGDFEIIGLDHLKKLPVCWMWLL